MHKIFFYWTTVHRFFKVWDPLHMVATLSGKWGKTKKNDKSPEKSGENGFFWKKVMKNQEIWYKNAYNKTVYHY